MTQVYLTRKQISVQNDCSCILGIPFDQRFRCASVITPANTQTASVPRYRQEITDEAQLPAHILERTQAL